MTLHQFKLLEKPEQIDLIKKLAIFLTQRIDDNYTYKLYMLDGIYIEEEWHTKFNERRSFTSFISEEKLQPYLQTIDISSLQMLANKNK